MDQQVQRDMTRGLADFVTGLGFEDLSADDTAHLGGLVLDHLGVALAGAALPWGRALAEWAGTYGGTGPS
ncbi:MAG: MmgE/PrpD family protein, partial [Proteobacteria bacterium]|nr:MmgE/PrpD family protein [Pseudomonadota bacterium]